MVKSFTCNRCQSEEKLKWPDEYKPGDLPINLETSRPHECIEERKMTAHWTCGFCETPLIDCGCQNCKYIGFPIYCPSCNIHPGALWNR